MNVTEVEIVLAGQQDDPRILGYCSVVFGDDFVLHELKIISGDYGPIVCMPSRKVTRRCFKCGRKNAVQNNYCGYCGCTLEVSNRPSRDNHADIFHPINNSAREKLSAAILNAYWRQQDLQMDHVGAVE